MMDASKIHSEDPHVLHASSIFFNKLVEDPRKQKITMGVSSSVPIEIKTLYFPEFEQTLPSLEGKTVCITGCTTGTGFIVARTAVRKGASNVLLLNRSSDRAEKAEQLLKQEKESSLSKSNIETIPCDLQDLESVKKAALAIKSKYEFVDVLCNNAGVMALEDVVCST